jgi:2-dehydro-3-deoxygluconokinase
MAGSYDVLVVGEVLAELSCAGSLRESASLRLSFSGDALNAAAAAAASGASTGLLARIGDDELGDALTEHVARCGVDTRLLRRVGAPNGMYIVTPDPDSQGGFVYMRRGSAGSTLAPADVDAANVDAGALVVSGVGQAISPTAAAAVERAARRVRAAGGFVVYDPNFRARLTSEAAAAEAFARIAPDVSVALPSHPGETGRLLGAATPEAAVEACLRLGADAAAVTCGGLGVVVGDASGIVRLPAVPAPVIVDATGAGDAFAGTLAARLVRGDTLASAAEHAAAAAARSLGFRGGTGWVAAQDEGNSSAISAAARAAPSVGTG